MEKYNSYKNTSIEWLGVIPEHWEVKRIKDVFNQLGSGTTPKSSNKTYYENGNINWLNTTDLKNNVIYDTKLKITQKALNEVGLKVYPINSLAIAMYGQGKTRGSIGLLKVPTTTNQAACIMSKPIGVDTKFMLYWFVSKYTDIRSINVGATQPNMNQDFVKFLILQKPSLKEQIQIANYLDSKTTAIDKKASLLQQKIKHYKAYRKTLINETVTKGLDKTVKLKDSGINWIGEIPEHWEVKRIKDIFNTLAGGTPSTKEKSFWIGEIPWIPSGAVQNGDVNSSIIKSYISEEALLKTSTKMARKDSILIALTGATCSNIGYLNFDTTINQSIVSIDSNQKYTSHRYYFYFLISAKEKIRTLMTGGAQGGINQGDVKYFKVCFTSKKEQQLIADYLDVKTATIDKIVNNIETQITTLKELRKTLINEVVTGKVKVSV